MTGDRPFRPWRRGSGARDDSRLSREVLAGVLAVVMVSATLAVAAALVFQGPADARSAGASAAASQAAARAAGMPRFFVDTELFGQGTGPLQVRSSATGRLVAQDQRAGGVTAVAALGARSFVIAEPVAGQCATRLYRIRLNRQGQPGRRTPLGTPELHGELFSLAASANRQVIGYAISGCQKFSPGHIGVIGVRSGRARQWGGVNPGGLSHGSVALNGALALSANGRLLTFTGWDARPDGSFTRQVVLVLRTDARPGTVAQRSRVVRHGPVLGPDLAAASLSPAGGTLYICTVNSGRTRHTVRVAAYRTATGQLRERLASVTARGPAPAGSMCPMALDASGGFLLVPYAIGSRSGAAGRAVARIARIGIASRAKAILTVTGPRTGGMDALAGLRVAW
jgi:hypothetical protein